MLTIKMTIMHFFRYSIKVPDIKIIYITKEVTYMWEKAVYMLIFNLSEIFTMHVA